MISVGLRRCDNWGMTVDRGVRRHRAQCSVCGDIIESVHPWDSVSCSCGRLSLHGGPQRPQVFWKAEPGSSWTDLSDEADSDDNYSGLTRPGWD